MLSNLIAALFVLSVAADSPATTQPHPGPAEVVGQCPQPCQASPQPLSREEADRRAFELQQSLCRAGDAQSCHTLAEYLRIGRGVERDPQRALIQFIRLCEFGRAASCNSAAVMYENGDGIPADQEKAEEYFRKAIDALDAELKVRSTIYWGVGGGLNFAPTGLGYQVHLTAIADPANGVTYLTTLGFELVGATRPGTDSVDAVARALTFSPLGIYLGPSVIRIGGSVDVSYGLSQTGGRDYDARGFGFGGSVGGGFALPGESFHLMLLGRYRWISGPRAGGVFIDLFISYKPPD